MKLGSAIITATAVTSLLAVTGAAPRDADVSTASVTRHVALADGQLGRC